MQATTGSASPARDGASEARSRASPDARLRIAPQLHLPPPFLFVLLPRTKVDFDDLAKPRHSRYFVTAMSALPKLASYLRIEERELVFASLNRGTIVAWIFGPTSSWF